MIESDAQCAIEALILRLRPFVAQRVSRPADVDDVLQDVFLRIQRGLPALRDRERFGPWTYQVARSAVAAYRRSIARHPVARDEPPEQVAPEGDLDEMNAAEREIASCVVPFVAMLPEPFRAALTLSELEGIPQKDVAAMLGISVSGAKSRIQRGRNRLRQMFEECCEIALDARGRVIACEPRDFTSCCDGQSERR